ncbi:MAG: hypothetical protein K2X55_04750 [Burkholderiaceae bacterium]|nr:hypothetical protein [Burkholderiaceae bacterium]
MPETGRVVTLRRTANISTGGLAFDVSADVHPDNRLVAERAAALLGLDIAGIDFLCPDISRSWRDVGGAVCEVNAQPGFRVHWLADPDRGHHRRTRRARHGAAVAPDLAAQRQAGRRLHQRRLVAGGAAYRR